MNKKHKKSHTNKRSVRFFMSEFNFRTDLASERREIYQKVNNVEGQIDGIESEKEKITTERGRADGNEKQYQNRSRKPQGAS